MSDQPDFICRECAYAKVSVRTLILSLFGLLPVSPYSFYCTRPKLREDFTTKELVVGAQPKPNMCTFEREDFYSRENICGPEGKHWTPKKKNSENLIKFMRK